MENSLFPSARQNVIAVSVHSCSDSAPLPCIFQNIKVWVSVVNGSCTPCKKAWLHYGELEGSEEPAMSSFLHMGVFM